MTFTLLSELGRGGMGVVWRARDEESGQIVALKLLRAAYADDRDYLERFTRELELTRRIHSAHVVGVLGYGVREGLPYLALEYVDGPSLRELLREHGAYGWPEARGLLAGVAQGLADAHAAGIVHRDVKPSNILLGSDGVAKLTDFGVSRGLDLTRVTGTSTMLGTPAYLAPEGPADERSDLYSLGCVAYELLAGAVPFEGRSYQEVILRHVREAPDLAKLPPEARPIVGALLAKEPGQRPQSAAALVGLLAGTAGPSAAPAPAQARAAPAAPPRRRRGALFAAAAIAVALLLVAVGTGLTAHPGASPAPGAPGASLAAVVVGSSVPSQAGGSPSAGLTPAAASPSAGAVVAAAAGATAGLGTTARPTPTASPAPALPTQTSLVPPHVVATVKVGRMPVGLTVGEGAVWTANANDRTVSRIDPATNRVVAVINVAEVPEAIAAGDGAVWLPQMTANIVVRIDPATNRVVAAIEAGDDALGIAAGPHGVWVTDQHHGTVSRIDPATNRVVAVIRTPDQATWTVADGPYGVWVTGDRGIYRIDPSRNTVVATVNSGGGQVIEGDGSVWATTNGGVLRIDPATDRLANTIVLPNNDVPAALVVGLGGVWVTHGPPTPAGSFKATSLSLIDPASGAVILTTPTSPVPGDIAADAGSLWVANPYGDTVQHLMR